MPEPISHEAPTRDSRSLPVMLPSKLVGRDVTLAKVYSQLKENKPVLIYGAPGIGKTAFAATLASAYTELPGGVLWMQVENAPLAELLARVGRAYGVPELMSSSSPLDFTGAAAAALAQHKPLIVLDGKPNPDASAKFAARVANRLPILILSDDELTGSWSGFRLNRLDPAQGATMYRQLAETSVGLEGLEALLSALDHVPFAIAIAAGMSHIRKSPPSQFLAALPNQPGTGVNPQLLALTAAFRALNNALQGLVLVLGATLRGEASAELISTIASAPVEAIQQAMTLLGQYQWVARFERYGRPHYRLHPITMLFAQSWLRGSGRLESLQGKFRDSMLAYAKKYSAPTSGAHDHLAAEMENIVATARRAAELGDRDTVRALIVALTQAGDFINARGYIYELGQLRDLAAPASSGAFPAHEVEVLSAVPTSAPLPLPPIEVDEEPIAQDEDEVEEELEDDFEEDDDLLIPAEEDEDEAPELLDEELNGDALDEDDDLLDDEEDDLAADSATIPTLDEEETPSEVLIVTAPVQPLDEIGRLRAQLMQARASGERRRQAELLSAIGRQQVSENKQNEAIATYSEALTVYETLNDSPGMLETLEALASLTARTDNSQAAVLHASRGAQLAHQVGSDTSEARLLTLLGDAHQQLGESDTAIRAYSQALDLVRANESPEEATVLFKLGYAQLDNGDPEEAVDTWEDALVLFREQGRRDYEGRILGALGTAYGELKRWTEAINFHTSALHIAREVKDRDEEALQLSYLGYASVQAKQMGQAVLRYRQALHLAYQSGNRENNVSTTVDLARLLVESPRHLEIANLLVESALHYDAHDKDLRRLKERLDEGRAALDRPQAAVTGTAEQYAANAYALLDG